MLKSTTSYLALKSHFYLGKLGKAFGLKGGLRFYAVGEIEARAIFKLKEVFITNFGKVVLQSVESKGSHTILFLAGVKTIDDVKLLANEKVYALVDKLPQLEEGDYYDAFLKKPVLVDGKEFGEITDLISFGKQGILVINDEYIIPLKADYVTFKDQAIHVNNPPKGLF